MQPHPSHGFPEEMLLLPASSSCCFLRVSAEAGARPDSHPGNVNHSASENTPACTGLSSCERNPKKAACGSGIEQSKPPPATSSFSPKAWEAGSCSRMQQGAVQTHPAGVEGGSTRGRARKEQHVRLSQGKVCSCTVTSLGCVAPFALPVSRGIFMI